MRISENFILRQVAETWVVLPLGPISVVDFNGMLTLNESGVLLWQSLEQGADCQTLADVLVAEYEVDRAVALADVQEFVDKLRQIGCIED